MSRITLVYAKCPGDTAQLTGLVENLVAVDPQLTISVKATGAKDLFKHNPNIKQTGQLNNSITINVDHSPVGRGDVSPVHYSQALATNVGRKIGYEIPVVVDRPVFYLGERESRLRMLCDPDHDLYGCVLVNAGYKKECSSKWWGRDNWQRIVDALYERGLHVVQVGHRNHIHPPLKRVSNLVGRTDLRDLMLMAMAARLALGPVSLLQHLCAAYWFEEADWPQSYRPVSAGTPYISIAGGREFERWTVNEENSKAVQLNVIGQLDCCETKPCYAQRVVPLADTSTAWNVGLCRRPIKENDYYIPECMKLITPEMVIEHADRLLNTA